MGLPRNPLPGQPPQLHGQVDSTSPGEQKEYHCTQVHTVRGAGGLLLGDVPRGGGRLLLHQAGAPPDRPRRGLPHGQSMSCIVIYCHESCDNYCHVRTYCHCQAAPLFGYLGDRYNRKFLLVLGMVIYIHLHTYYLHYLNHIYTISTQGNLGFLLPDLQLHALLHTLPLRAGTAQHRYRVGTEFDQCELQTIFVK